MEWRGGEGQSLGRVAERYGQLLGCIRDVEAILGVMLPIDLRMERMSRRGSQWGARACFWQL